MRTSLKLLTVMVAAGTASVVYGDSFSAGVGQALKEGKADLNLRYRYEYVDQEPLAETAGASTLRSRLGWTSGQVAGIQGRIEVDNVTSIGAERYNDTLNGKGTYPVVADPTGTDLNQAWLSYTAAGAVGTLGRQRILHGDERFVGGVAWRQNEQTYDAVRVVAPAGPVKFDYSYIWRVHTVFGNDSPQGERDGKLHALRADYALNDKHSLAGYVYELDFDDFAALSNRTLGLDYTGAVAMLKLHLALATQQDTGDQPVDYSALYYLADVTANAGPVALNLGYEVLGSDDGKRAFQTPLATLHKFQGFADKFLATPANGIRDLYAGVGGAVAGVKLNATYHIYTADEGSADYGDEINLSAAYAITPNVSVLAKYARYSADELFTDTDKAWLMVTAGF